MADLRITDLPALTNVAAGDFVPVADVSASETKKVTAKDLVQVGVGLIDNASIPAAKLAAINPASLGTSTAAAQFIAGPTATTGAFAARTIASGDLPLATTAAAGAVVIGAGLSVSGGTVTAAVATSATRGAVSVPTASGLTVDGSGVLGHASSVTAQTKNGFTVNASGHITAVGSITATDLPPATSVDLGGVSVGSGLSVTIGGQLNHASTITAGTTSGITYNATGHITGVAALAASDLPSATTSAKGAVSVPAGALSVSGAGALTHNDSGVVAGSYAKVTVDAKGHVTAGGTLSASDIPELSASKITSGTFSNALLGTKSITGVKLADYATVQFGGASSTSGVVTFPTPEFAGQGFFDKTNGDYYIWDSNSWQPLTVISGDLIYAGTYNANTNKVKSTTTQGAAAGLIVGSALPAASSTNLRYYVVVSDSGTGTSPAPAVALAPPDMIVSNGATWDLIDVSNAIAGQTANNISYTPYGSISSTNLQAALQELDDKKLAVTGGSITGELRIAPSGSFCFEGSADDAYETYFAVVNPTADRTITFPDSSGTVVLSGTIVNADINASAAIAGSKIQAGSTSNAGVLQLTDSTSSTSTTTAATPNSVKSAYDLADAAMPKSGGTFTGPVTIPSGSTITGYLTTATASSTYAPLASPTLTGQPYVNGSYRGNVAAVSALDIDCSTANFFTKTINANSTFTVSNVPPAAIPSSWN